MVRKVLAGLGLALCLEAAPLLAQPANDPAKAMEKYEEAERYYKLAEYETALRLYRESYLLSGEPELLFNIGQCNRQLLRYEEALKSYKAYLRDVPDSPARPEIEALIKEVTGKLGPQPASQPTSEATTRLTTQPASTPQRDPAPPTPRAGGLFIKGGAGVGGAGLILGGVSLVGARRLNATPPDDLLLFTQQQRSYLVLAGVSDVLFLAGIACVGVGVTLRQVGKLRANTALQVDGIGARATLSLEF